MGCLLVWAFVYVPQVKGQAVRADNYGGVLAYWRGVAWACVAILHRRCSLCPVMVEPVSGVCYVRCVGVEFAYHCVLLLLLAITPAVAITLIHYSFDG